MLEPGKSVRLHVYHSNEKYLTPGLNTAALYAEEALLASGTSKTTFSPNATCTQGEILTFLWRAYVSPKPSGKVSGSEYYAVPLQWTRERGVISGNLDPKAPCTRSDVVTYLWKLAGSPSAKAASFSDVPASAGYARAVNWAVALQPGPEEILSPPTAPVQEDRFSPFSTGR